MVIARRLGVRSEWNDFSGLLRAYRSALEQLRSWGIRIQPGSRLLEYESQLDKANSPYMLRFPEEFVNRLTFVLREIDEVIEIVHAFNAPPDHNVFAKLRLLPQGADYPDADTKSSTRDTQYELFLFAQLQRFGIKAQIAEPDLVIQFPHRAIPLEAKRPKREAGVEDRLRKAVRQLSAVDQSGIVALSLDEVLRPSHTYLSGKPGSAGSYVEKLIHNFVDSNLPMIRGRVGGAPVTALLFTARVPARDPDTNMQILASAVHAELLVENGPDERAIQRIVRAVGGEGFGPAAGA